MKTFYLLSVILCFTIQSVFSKNVPVEKAQKIAMNWYRHYDPSGKGSGKIKNMREYKYGDKICFFIFNFDPEGFVIVSAYDNITPVLGYAYNGHQPEILQDSVVNILFKDYSEQIIKSDGMRLEAATFQTKWEDIAENRFLISSLPDVEPLLTTHWGQGWPFNALCPEDPSGSGGHVAAGCIPVAMAQIMKYYNYPEHGSGKNGYQFLSYPYTEANFRETHYGFTEMPDDVSEVNENIAELIYHCGISLGAAWRPGNTSLIELYLQDGLIFHPVVAAFNRNFNYAASTIRYLEMNDFSEAQWDSILRNDLYNSRPVYYEITGINHALVIDGVQNDNYYHFNFGWEGASDGFYLLSAIGGNPGWGGIQRAITGIKPNDGSTVTSDTTWNGKIHFLSDVAIADGVTLNIDPGTEMLFAKDKRLMVWGRLLSNGNENSFVRFSAIDSLDRWKGIKWEKTFNHNDSSKLVYTKIERSGNHGIYCKKYGKILIDHCFINDNVSSCIEGADDVCSGGGILTVLTQINITNSRIFRNKAQNDGGGIRFENLNCPEQNSKISNNHIYENESGTAGGGVVLFANKVRFENNVVYDNKTAWSGAGLSTNLGNNIIMNNRFFNNNSESVNGGGICINNDRSWIVNNLFTNNSAFAGAGISIVHMDTCTRVINNTFANNKSDHGQIYVRFGFLQLKNSIVYCNDVENTGYFQIYQEGCDSAIIENCVIQGGRKRIYGPVNNYPEINTIIDKDPLFVSPTYIAGIDTMAVSANWEVKKNSPCIDAGDTLKISRYLPDKDLSGNLRLFGEIDIGAYESSFINHPPVADAGSDQSVSEGKLVIMDGSASSDPDGDTLTFRWTSHEGIALSDATSMSPTFTAPKVKKDSVLIFILVVNDGSCDSPADTVRITIKNEDIIQTIYLETGWNIISFHVIPDSSDMKTIFRSLINDKSLVKVQNEAGISLEDYGIFGGWINHIGNISLTEGYKVKVNKVCLLSTEGVPPQLPFQIILTTGWNIAGYPLQTEADGLSVIQQLIDRKSLVKIQDERGNAIEDWGVFGGWQNIIGNFKPGEGYKIKMKTNDTLTLY